jgi:DNA-nicking Smr family endonuclease
VLIITGKGQKDGSMPWYETRGVIREALPSWLNLPEIRPFILSMSPATQADGGSGAMYVLLKRHRTSN